MIEHPVPAVQVNAPRPYWRGLLVCLRYGTLHTSGYPPTLLARFGDSPAHALRGQNPPVLRITDTGRMRRSATEVEFTRN